MFFLRAFVRSSGVTRIDLYRAPIDRVAPRFFFG
jgi:hypothetical protein